MESLSNPKDFGLSPRDLAMLEVSKDSAKSNSEKEGLIFSIEREQLDRNLETYLSELSNVRLRLYQASGYSPEQIEAAEVEYKKVASEAVEHVNHLRLVHRTSQDNLGQLLDEKVFKSSAQVTEGSKTNTFDMDRKLGRDQGVYFTLGHGLMGEFFDQATVVLSEQTSQDYLKSEKTIINAMDWSDVIRLMGITEDDIDNESERYKSGLSLYKSGIFSGKDTARVIGEYVATFHGGDFNNYHEFLRDYDENKFGSLSMSANRVYVRNKILPMVPEVIIHQSQPVSIDQDSDIFSASELDQWIVNNPDASLSEKDTKRANLIKNGDIQVVDIQQLKTGSSEKGAKVFGDYVARVAGMISEPEIVNQVNK